MFKIAIIGPESTGKSELAQQLAMHFKSPWVPEYAREYVENLKTPYSYNDICNIAKKQIEEEKYYNTKSEISNFVFFDTDLIITKVWFEYKFQKVPEFLSDYLKVRKMDLYLLCSTDIEWKPDSVREHGNDREYFYTWYKREIELTNTPCCCIGGIGNQRFLNAIKSLDIFKI